MQIPYIAGERIYLRGIQRTDVEGPWLEWLNDQEICHKLASGRFPTTREDLLRFYEQVTTGHNNVMFAIIDIEAEHHVGNIKLGPIDWVNRTSLFGTLIGDKGSWGKGFASEAVSLMLSYAFDTLNLWKILSYVRADNVGSIRKNEKAGMKVEAVLRQDSYRDGIYYDTAICSITREEWLNRAGKVRAHDTAPR